MLVEIDDLEHEAQKLVQEKKESKEFPPEYFKDLEKLELKQKRNDLIEKYNIRPFAEAGDILNQFRSDIASQSFIWVVIRKFYTIVIKALRMFLRRPFIVQSDFNKNVMDEVLRLYQKVDELEKKVKDIENE